MPESPGLVIKFFRDKLAEAETVSEFISLLPLCEDSILKLNYFALSRPVIVKDVISKLKLPKAFKASLVGSLTRLSEIPDQITKRRIKDASGKELELRGYVITEKKT